MGLNNIVLPETVVADLYKTVLLDSEINSNLATPSNANEYKQEIQIGPENESPSWKFLGSNLKQVTILTTQPTAVYLPDEELALLTGILGACQLTLADVAIINLFHYPGTSYKELVAYFNSKTVLLFDIEPALLGLPISFPQFQVQPFSNISYLYSPALKVLEHDKVLKSKLWVCLRRIFGI